MTEALREHAARLAAIAQQLNDAGDLETICTALEAQKLTLSSRSATWATIAGGKTQTIETLRALHNEWRSFEAEISPQLLALILRSANEVIVNKSRSLPRAQVVWTGPTASGSYLRSTREVIRELVRNAHNNILVVGYWIVTSPSGEGSIVDFVRSLAKAAENGVTVTLVLDHRRRSDGTTNLETLINAWPNDRVPLPKILTWRLPENDHHAKLHAKILVADAKDALITSANLTLHGLNHNMEMGVRITGQPAADIVHHFQNLEVEHVIEPFIA